MSKNEPARSSAVNSIVGPGSTFTGNMRVEGGLRVDGKIEGTVEVAGTLTVGNDGLINGEVIVDQAIVGGSILGTVRSERQLELQSGSRLEGDIYTRSLIIEEGVFFEGNCKMRQDTGSGQ
ncbi:polymer-forming cytoskeletal protein [Candidatus Fermentibacterales bacterium]|nr:polymer-forming cytoskeletal protein [Candidatus Fermentibacterales bacterium]